MVDYAALNVNGLVMVVESGEWGRGRNPIDELAMAAKSGEQRKRTRSVRRERRIEPLKRER